MTKKRFFKQLALMALMLVINISGAWALPPSTHSHCVCGDGTCTVGGHSSHPAVTWNAWFDAGALPTEAGYYYLDTDVTLASTWTPADGTYLCLNGHSITKTTANGKVIEVKTGTTFTLTDCDTRTKHKWVKELGVGCYTSSPHYRWKLDDDAGGEEGTDYWTTTGGYVNLASTTERKISCGINVCGTLNLYGGNIVGNHMYCEPYFSNSGAGIRVESGTVNMYGGRVCGNSNSDYGTGIGLISSTSKLYLMGGSIDYNDGPYAAGIMMLEGAEAVMSGGTISNNNAGDAAVVLEKDNCTFTMTGGSIINNWGSSSGGLYSLGSNGSVNLLGGTITGNKTTQGSTGGVCVRSTRPLILGGSVKIYGNYKGQYPNNLYLPSYPSNQCFAISDKTPLTTGADIRVSTDNKPSVTSPITVSTNTGGKAVTASDLQYFKSDTSIYKLRFVTDHIELQKYVPHKHCVCGDNKCSVGGHKHDNTVVWTEWESTTSLPSTKGYYYLADDVKLTSTWQPADGTYLCLNGHSITKTNANGKVIEVASETTFTLTDCNTTTKHSWVKELGSGCYYGKHYHWQLKDDATGTEGTDYWTTTGGYVNLASTTSNGISCGINVCGTLNLYRGNIVGNHMYCGPQFRYSGSGIRVDNGTVFMYGGRVCGNSNSDYGTGIGLIAGTSKLYLMGGSIDYNDGEYSAGIILFKGTEAVMSGGTISNNNGGMAAVVLEEDDCTFTMTGGSIINNFASWENYGGGLYSEYNNGSVNLLGGTITGNKTTNGVAGGVYVTGSRPLILGGSMKIYGNYKGQYPNNLYLLSNKYFAISDKTSLTTGADIRVSTANKPTETAPITVSTNTGGQAVTASDLQYFKSDTSIYKLKFVTDHIELQKPVPHKHCVCGDGKCTVGGHKHNTVEWEEWNETTSLPSTKGYYYLANDVTLASQWEPADSTFLCLNGHIVKQTAVAPVINIANKQKLTITDCDNKTVHRWVPAATPTATDVYWTLNDDIKGEVDKDYFTTTGGVITGGKYGRCGGIRVGYGDNSNNYGVLDFFAGNVVGNTCTTTGSYGFIGGGIRAERGTLNFYGGRVCGNSANLGAGIAIDGSRVKANILGGQIDHNYGNGGCGITTSQYPNELISEPLIVSNVSLTDNINAWEDGCCIDNYSDKCWLRLTNVTISNNTGGGIYNKGKLELFNCNVTNNTGESGVKHNGWFEGVELIVGGTTKITGNTNASGNQKNLNLYGGAKLAIDTISGLAFGANIGVTPPYSPSLGNPVAITSNGVADDVQFFTCDNANYCVNFNTDHLELAVPVCKNLVTNKGYASIKSAIYDAISNDTIQMIQNIKENVVFNQRPDTLEILTLDLNGKTLTGLGTSSVIEIGKNANLTIMDSQKTGKITGGIGRSGESGLVRDGGAIYNDGGNLTITGGTITGNSCTVTDEGGRAWGGAIANDCGTLTITGGTITGNYCSGAWMSWGGGVYNTGTMTMTGGKICGNYVTGAGNKQGGGVANLFDCTFNVGGSAVITDNTIGGAANNVEILYVKTNADGHDIEMPATGYLTISTDKPFVLGAQIGVSTPVAKPWKITTNGTANDAQYFVSDSTQYAITCKKDHLELAYPDCEIGGKVYASLQDAATAAKTNDVIDMYENASETDTVVVGASKKFDINVTNPYKNSSSFINNGDVTVKDGEFAVKKIFNNNALTFNNATVKADSIFSAGTSFKFLGSDTIVGAKITGANLLTVGQDANNPAYVTIKGESSLTDLEIQPGSVVSFLGNTTFAPKKANGFVISQGAIADLNGNVKVDANSTFTLQGILNWNLANNPVIEVDRPIANPNNVGKKTITVDGKMRESQYLGYYNAISSANEVFYLTGGNGSDKQIILDGGAVVYNEVTYELKSSVTSAKADINNSGTKTSAGGMVKKSLYLTVRPSNPEIAVTTADKWFKKGEIVKIEGTLKDDSKSGYKSLSVLGLGKTPIDATSGISDNDWSYTYTGPNTKGTDLKFVIMNNLNLTDTASYTLKVDTVAPYAKSVKITNSQYNNVDYTDQWIVDEENLVVTIQLNDTTSGGVNNVTVLCDGTPLVEGTHYSFNAETGVLTTVKGLFEKKLAPTTLSVSAKDLAGNLMEKEFLFKTCYGRIIVETDSMKTLENVDFRTDPYPYHGGAVYIYDRGTFNANNVVFDGNVATLGAAIYNTGTTNLAFIEFEGNKSKMGGAIYNFDGIVNINGHIVLTNDSDTWVNEGYKTSEIPQYAVTNWNLGETPDDNEAVLYGYEKFANYGHYANQTITVAKNQTKGSYLIATGDFSNVENKDKFYITGVDGQEDIAVFIDGATKNYDGQGYTLETSGRGLYLTIGEPLAKIDVAVSSMNKATIYSDKNLVVPAGVRVFGMRWDDSKNMLVCTNSRAYTDGDILPAEMGYVIEAPAATYSFLETEQDASVVSLSELSGVVVETPTDEVEGTVFTLANGYNGVGFYTFVGETLKANKAFYNSTNPNLKGYLGCEDTTGIESLDANANANANALYNLQGVKVNKNYRGVVIKNGKKVLMK